MSTQDQYESKMLALVNFSRELTLDVHKVLVSVGRLEQAYQDVNGAAVMFSATGDEDQIGARGMLETMLFQDMNELSASILLMLDAVKHFIRVLLNSAEEVFCACVLAPATALAADSVYKMAETEVSRSINILKGLSCRLNRLR